jgi:hypothetical protein
VPYTNLSLLLYKELSRSDPGIAGIELGERFTLSQEAIVDFVDGSTTVYVLGFSLGYGF